MVWIRDRIGVIRSEVVPGDLGQGWVLIWIKNRIRVIRSGMGPDHLD